MRGRPSEPAARPDEDVEGAQAPGPSLEALLSPSSVAIVGDSPRVSRGGSAHEQLRARGFGGSIYPVNPRYAEVRGEPCWPDLGSLPALPDLVLVATPASIAVDVVEQCAELGVPAATVFGSGFAEAGEQGALLQSRLRAAATGGGVALCGPNCYGVANLFDRVAATTVPLPADLPPGGLALVLQSGALSHGLIDFAVRRHAGIGYLVTTGNEAVLDVADYLRTLADDARVRSVAIYVEAIRRPAVFLESVDRLAGAGIPVTVLKSGRSEGGRRATMAHTGAVGDDARIWSAMLRSVGAVQVDDLGVLAEAALFALDRPFGAGHRRSGDGDAPFLMSFSGAAASVLADLAEDVCLDLRQPDHALSATLRDALPAQATVANPLDLTGFIADDPARIAGVVQAYEDATPSCLPVMVLNSPSGTTTEDRELYLATVRAVAGDGEARTADDGPSGPARAVATMLPGDLDPDVLESCRRHGLPVVTGMRTLVTVLAARAAAERGRDAWERSRGAPGNASLAASARAWISSLDVAPGGGIPGPAFVGEGTAKELLARAGIETPRRITVHDVAEAPSAASEIGFPVAVKVDDPAVPHKSRAGCIVVGLHDHAAVASAAEMVLENAARVVGQRPVRGMAVEEQVADGADIFVGVIRTDDLDPVLVAAAGGSAVEAGIGALALRLPADRRACADALERSALGVVASSVGDRPEDGVDALVDVLVRVSEMACSIGADLRALDLNPVRLVVGRPGASLRQARNRSVRAVALDALIEIE